MDALRAFLKLGMGFGTEEGKGRQKIRIGGWAVFFQCLGYFFQAFLTSVQVCLGNLLGSAGNGVWNRRGEGKTEDSDWRLVGIFSMLALFLPILPNFCSSLPWNPLG